MENSIKISFVTANLIIFKTIAILNFNLILRLKK
jgi:hypothetical protein